jgi:hypothetical protein
MVTRAGLGLLVVFVVAVSPAAAEHPASTLPPPGIHSNPAWLTVTTGPTNREGDHLSQTEGVNQASVGMNIRGSLGRIRFNL